MSDDKVRVASRIHLVCAAVHIISAITIFAVGLSTHPLSTYNIEISKTFMGVTKWKFNCFDEATASYAVGYADCDDDNKLFHKVVDSPMAGPGFNVLLAAFSFAMVSGVFHLFNAALYAVKSDREYDANVEHTLRFVDYAISAPIMLALINALWGASNVSGVVLSPIVLCVLLLVANYIATRGDDDTTMTHAHKQTTFGVLVVLFGVCLLPVISATYSAVSTSNKAHNEGSAPTFVAAFVGAFLLVFSSFIVPYYQALRVNFKVDKIIEYCVLSIVAKVTLHALLGVAVIQQTSMTTQNATEKTDAPDEPAPTLGFMIAGGVILSGVALAIIFEWYAGGVFVEESKTKVPDTSYDSFHATHSAWSTYSSYSVFSIGSFVTIGSTLSATSVFSVMSFGSIGSIMSIHSVGCIGGVFQDCTASVSERGGMMHVPGTLAYSTALVFLVQRIARAKGVLTRLQKATLAVAAVFVVTLHGTRLIDGSIMYTVGMATLFLAFGIIFGDGQTAEPTHSWWSIAQTTISAMLAIMGFALVILDHVMLDTNTAVIVTFSLMAAILQGAMVHVGMHHRGRAPLGQTSLVLLVIAASFLATVVPPHSEPKVASYEVPGIAEYGVGEEKRFAVIRFGNLTEEPGVEYMHTWSDLHMDDKKVAEITFYGSDTTSNDTYVIGIEQKGKDRDVPNVSIEFRENENHDKDDEKKPYTALKHAYEDWWLTFGAPGDVTHMRQMFANTLYNPGVDSVLIEVITEIDGRYYYEGVGLLVPKLTSKDIYDEDGNGNDRTYTGGPDGTESTKCKEGQLNLFISEYNDGGKRKQPFRDVEVGGWDHKYPKDSKLTLEECGNATIQADAFARRTKIETLVGSRSFDNPAVKSHELLKAYIYETILGDTDYPFRSQYWVLDGNETLWPGMLWDYNSAGYRGKDPRSKFAITNIYPTYGWADPPKLPVEMCERQRELFSEHSHSALFTNTLNRAMTSIQTIQDQLKHADVVAAFERADRRNQHFGMLAGRHLHLMFASIHSMMNKQTYTKEVEYQAWWLRTRAQHVLDRGKTDTCTVEKSRAAAWMIIVLLALPVCLFALLVVGLLWAFVAGDGVALYVSVRDGFATDFYF